MIGSTRIGSLVAAAVAVGALAVAGCGAGTDGSGATAPPTSADGRPATVGVASGGRLGEILVDSHGRTLYLFQKDAGTMSACAGACAVDWPPLRAAGRPVLGAGLTASKLGTTARSDGEPELTYNGHPLYLYAADEKPGDTNGQGITAFGGGWFALSPSGNIVSATASNPSHGYGY
jgi:predicted lipoprotein with Yx(FWY)xxD motif